MIDEIQNKIQKEKIVNKLIKNGIKPTQKNVISELNDYYVNHKLGNKTYSHKQLHQGDISNKDNYNKEFNNIYNDISVMYDSYNNIYNSMITLDDKIDSISSEIKNNIAYINNKIKNINNILSGEQYNYYTYTFSNYSNTEFNEVKKINLFKTTAFVDLLNQRVTNNKVTNTQSIVDISNCSITTSASEIKGSINDLLLMNNKSCKIINDSISKNSKLKISLVFNEAIMFNTLKIQLDSLEDVSAYIEVYDKNNNCKRYCSSGFKDSFEWNTNELEKSSLVNIYLSKNDYDSINDNLYRFIYIIRNITLCNDTYTKNSIYVSKPVEINDLFNEIKLEKKDKIFSDTSIDYYISIGNTMIDSKYDNPELLSWININSKKYTDLNILTNKTLLKYANNNNMYKYNNKKLYKICDLDKYTDTKNIKIQKQYQQFKVMQLKPNDKFDKKYELNINDFINNYDVKYIDCESYDLNIKTNTFYAFTQSINCDDECYSYNHFIKLINSDNQEEGKTHSLSYKVYLNNDIVTVNDDDTYSFSFKKGINTLVIIAYVNSDYLYADINFNFNLKDITNNIYSSDVMEYKTPYELTNKNLYNCYTIIKNSIYVLDNPENTTDSVKSVNITKSDINYQDKIRYKIEYKYLKDENYNYAKYIKDNQICIPIRFMCVLNSKNNKVSPHLYQYSLLLK